MVYNKFKGDRTGVCDMVIKNVEVICEHKSDGTVIPLRFRILDEDGIYQSYTVKAFRMLDQKGSFNAHDGIFVTHDTDIFECRIELFGLRKNVRLYFTREKTEWMLAV